jgi:DNA polymerase
MNQELIRIWARMQEDPDLEHLHAEGQRFVPGRGREFMPRCVMIGEAPGKNEDANGQPFVGAAGGVLNEMLDEIGLSREDIWITNVIKWRPPHNRTPTLEEIAAARHYLRLELEALSVASQRGKRIGILLGGSALRAVAPTAQLSQVAGRWLERPGRWRWLVTWHPATVLYSPAKRGTLSGQFSVLRRALT